MLHAAAMFLVYTILAALVLAGAAAPWLPPVLALVCVLISLRFGGVSGAFASLPRNLYWRIERAGAAMLGVLRTLRAALAADITLSPALLRLRSRAIDEQAAANLAAMISATPGAVVVGVDAGSLLVHVINEGAGELTDYARLETLACGERP